jgi:hypothetical protein
MRFSRNEKIEKIMAALLHSFPIMRKGRCQNRPSVYQYTQPQTDSRVQFQEIDTRGACKSLLKLKCFFPSSASVFFDWESKEKSEGLCWYVTIHFLQSLFFSFICQRTVNVLFIKYGVFYTTCQVPSVDVSDQLKIPNTSMLRTNPQAARFMLPILCDLGTYHGLNLNQKDYRQTH